MGTDGSKVQNIKNLIDAVLINLFISKYLYAIEMEKPAKQIGAYAATGLMALNKFIHELDIVLFKVTIDYITRNFDPTGININGLIDSAWAVLIKPAMLSFTKTSICRFTNFKQAIRSLIAQRPTLKKLHPAGWQRHPGLFN